MQSCYITLRNELKLGAKGLGRTPQLARNDVISLRNQRSIPIVRAQHSRSM